jgi:hypothetical protein
MKVPNIPRNADAAPPRASSITIAPVGRPTGPSGGKGRVVVVPARGIEWPGLIRGGAVERRLPGVRLVVVFSWVLLLGAAVGLTSCAFTATPGPTNLPTPGIYLRDGIPMPTVDSAVEGGYQYLGNGRFLVESGREFFWRDGRFVNTDGSPMEIPPSAKEHLHELGIDAQPTAAVTHYPTPRLDASPRQGVSLTVTLSRWDYIVCAGVEIRNESGSPFRFANKDLQLYVNGTRVEQTNPGLAAFEIASGAGTEFRTDVYSMVDQFDSASGGLLYTSSDPRSRGFTASDGPAR